MINELMKLINFQNQLIFKINSLSKTINFQNKLIYNIYSFLKDIKIKTGGWAKPELF